MPQRCFLSPHHDDPWSALGHRDAWLRLALKASRLGAWDWDLATDRQLWSPELSELLGLPHQEERSAAAFFALVHPDDLPRIRAHAAEAGARGDSSLEDAFRIIRPDGEERWISSRAQLHRDAQGQLTRLTGVNLDITETKRLEHQQQFLLDLERTLRQITEPEALAHAATRLLGQQLRVDGAYFVRLGVEQAAVYEGWSTKGTLLTGSYRLDAFITPDGSQKLRLGEPLAVADVATHPATAVRLSSYEALAIQAFVSFPEVYAGTGRAILTVVSGTPRVWRDDELRLIGEVASRVWPLVERAEAERARQQSDERLNRLQALTARLAVALTPDDIVQAVLAEGLPALGGNAGSVVRLDGDELVIVGTTGFSDEQLGPWRRFPLSSATPLAEVIRTGAPIWVESVEQYEEQFQRRPDASVLAMSQSWAALPLIVNGRVIGALGLSYAQAQAFDAPGRRFADSLADLCAQALERASLFAAEREARQRLETTSAQLAAVLEAAPVGIIVAHAPDGALIIGNRAVAQIWRQPFIAAGSVAEYAAYIGYRPDGSLLQPEEWPLTRSLRTGEVVDREEIRFRRGDGTLGTMLVSSAPICDRDNALVAGVVAFLDISDRALTEEALRTSEYRLRIATAAANIGIHDYDVESDTVTWDERVRALWGASADEEIAYATFAAGLHPDDLAATNAAVQRALDPAGDGRYAAEYRVIHRLDGQERWVAATGQAFFHQGQAVRLIGTVQDVTERKRHEQHVRFLAVLNEQFARLTSVDELMEVAGDAIRQHLRVSRVFFIEIDIAGRRSIVLADRCDPALPSTVGSYDLDTYGTPAFLDELMAGRPVVIDDVRTHPITADAAERFAALQIGATLNAPYLADGGLRFLLAVQHRGPYPWRPDEVELLMDLAARVWTRLDRARAEARLRQSEAEFRTISNAAPALVWVFDGAGAPLYFNDSWYAYTGQRSEESAGAGWTATLHPDDEQRILPYWERCCATGETYEGEVRYRRHDGVYRWHSFRALPRFHEDGRIAAWYGVSFDIHDRREAEEQLRQSERRFKQVFNQQFQFSALLQPDGVVVDLNESAALATGVPATAVVGRPFWDAPWWRELPEVQAGWRAQIAAALQQDRAVIGEAAYILADGSLCFAVNAVTALRDEAGNVQFLLVEGNDITQRKAAEARLAAVLEQLPVAVSVLDRQGKVILLNSLMRQYVPAAIAAPNADEPIRWRTWSADGIPLPPGQWPALRALRGETVVPGLEFLFTDDAGRERWTAVNTAPLRDDRGEISGAIVVIQDINERKRAEAQLHELQARRLAEEQAYTARLQELYAQEQAARAQAEEASRIKDEFLATVSHELRTPLTSLLGYAQMLQLRRRDEVYIARTVDKIVRSAKAQAQIIEDLLDVSRIVSGKLTIVPERVELVPVVQAAVETVQPTIEAKGQTLVLRLDPDAGAVRGDPHRLQQVFWNLLTNATKFTPSGGTIAVTLQRRGTAAAVVVNDTGQGMAPEFLPHAFSQFRQADSSTNRAHGGLGLGLAIVRHLVELQGGSVTATSDGVGRGATFMVQLPLLSDDRRLPPADGAEPVGVVEAEQPPELAGVRVLVVDDDALILELLDDVLASYGASVQTCATAPEALQLFTSWRPDVLVCDLAMPEHDGFWLIREIRSLRPERGGRTPAAALTAYVRLEDRLRVLAAGFQQYLPKPVEPAELRAVVAELVRAEQADGTESSL